MEEKKTESHSACPFNRGRHSSSLHSELSESLHWMTFPTQFSLRLGTGGGMEWEPSGGRRQSYHCTTVTPSPPPPPSHSLSSSSSSSSRLRRKVRGEIAFGATSNGCNFHSRSQAKIFFCLFISVVLCKQSQDYTRGTNWWCFLLPALCLHRSVAAVFTTVNPQTNWTRLILKYFICFLLVS